MIKAKKIKSILALILCVIYTLQGGGLTAEAKVLPENSRYVPHDSSEYSISVTPETARYYLGKIREAEHRVYTSDGSFDFSPQIVINCIDIDQNGADELVVYERNCSGYLFEFNIYSSEGEICSESIDMWHCDNIVPYYAIAESHVIGTTVEYHNMNYVTLYEMKNGKMEKVAERFLDAHPSGDVASYTDANGNIIENAGGINSEKSIPIYDLVEQILKEAKKRDVNFEKGFILKEDELGSDFKVTINGDDCNDLSYDPRTNTELIKKSLQQIIDADNRGENLIQPTDSIYQDIVDTLMVWGVAFKSPEFDLTLGTMPQQYFMFDWFECAEGTETISLDTAEKRKTFSDNISPVYKEALDHFYDNYEKRYDVTKLNKNLIDKYLCALYGTDFDTERYYNTYFPGAYQLASTKDGQLYGWVAMATGDGRYFNVTAIADLGEGFYLAYLNNFMDYPDVSLLDESYVLLRKAPDDAELKYHIVKGGEGTPNLSDIRAAKSRAVEANTKYDYEKAAQFTEAQQFIDYLNEQLEALNGVPINDKGKQETIKYIQHLYENAAVSELSAKGNKIVLNRKNLESASLNVKDVVSKTEAVLEKYGVDLNKELFATVRLNTTSIKEKKRINVEIHADALEVLKEFDSVRIALNGRGVGFAIQTEDMKALVEKNNISHFTINQDGTSYALVFQDSNKKEISQCVAPITLYLPADTPYAFVEAQYGEHLDNWGGQYDEMNGLIFFNTKYSGLYTVTENEIEITDIADLTEEQQNMIRFMVSKGFFSVEDGVFAPNKVLSRYDFATALVGMFFALDREAVCSFDDVPKDSSYYPYVASAEQSNIAAGVSSNKFAGDRMVTKEEVVAFCTRTLIDKKGYEVAEDIENYANYTDRDSIAAWALPEVALAEQLGLIVSGGEFGPKGEITRLESVEVLYRLFMMLYEVSPAKAQFYEDTAGNDLPIVPIVVGLGAVGVGAYLYMNKKGINQKKDKK